MVDNEAKISLESDASEEGIAKKAFSFDGAIQRGDCRIEPGAIFTLYSDGSSNWNCQISSGDANDTWKGTFTFRSSSGGDLFTTGSYELEIVDKDVKKKWDLSREANSEYAQWFDSAFAIQFNCNC